MIRCTTAVTTHRPFRCLWLFSILAAEMNDEKLLKGLLKTVDNHFDPVLGEGGTYHYPYKIFGGGPNLDENIASALRPVEQTLRHGAGFAEKRSAEDVHHAFRCRSFCRTGGHRCRSQETVPQTGCLRPDEVCTHRFDPAVIILGWKRRVQDHPVESGENLSAYHRWRADCGDQRCAGICCDAGQCNSARYHITRM